MLLLAGEAQAPQGRASGSLGDGFLEHEVSEADASSIVRAVGRVLNVLLAYPCSAGAPNVPVSDADLTKLRVLCIAVFLNILSVIVSNLLDLKLILGKIILSTNDVPILGMQIEGNTFSDA